MTECRRSRLGVVAGGIALLVSGAIAGAADDQDAVKPPRFEVASVKPNTSGDGASRSSDLPDGGYIGSNVTLRRLIIDAYGVQSNQIVDPPDWLNSDHFDITARGSGVDDQTPARLRALLAERFRFAAHTEKRPRPVYALTLARADRGLGPDLKPSSADCSFGTADQPKRSGCGVRGSTGNWGGTLSGVGQTLPEIADALGDHGVDRPVVDKTGLAGSYDFQLRWASNPNPEKDEVSLVTALREQLGLALGGDTAPVDVLVIDRVERPDPD